MRKEAGCQWYHSIGLPLKVQNFFGSEFEFCTISFFVSSAEILRFCKKKMFGLAHEWGRYDCSA
jgi:hypothetical protein